MELLNCRNNDKGVMKSRAKFVYEDILSTEVSKNRITAGRKQELLAKIEKVATADDTS